jgi:hypothetical protein
MKHQTPSHGQKKGSNRSYNKYRYQRTVHVGIRAAFDPRQVPGDQHIASLMETDDVAGPRRGRRVQGPVLGQLLRDSKAGWLISRHS